MSSPQRISLATAGLAVTLALTAVGPPASAAQSQINLKTAASFAVLAGTTVTNTGPTTIVGDVGVSPGSEVGLLPVQVQGTIHSADDVALTAQNDVTEAYNDAADRGPTVDQTDKNLGGQTLEPGVYNASTSMSVTGTLILDAKGDPNAVFIFQAGSTLNFATNSTVALIGEAQACNVFWQVGSSATMVTGSTVVGSVLALTTITMQTNAKIQGRLLARNGAVNLDSNVITRPGCSVAPPVSPSVPATPTATASSTPSAVATTATPGGDESSDGGSSDGPGGDGSDGGGSDGGGSDGGSGTDTGLPVVPTGHPETGKGAVVDVDDSNLWLLAALLCIGGAAVAAGLGSRSRSSSARP